MQHLLIFSIIYFCQFLDLLNKEKPGLGDKPKISGPLTLLGFWVVDSNLPHSNTAGTSQDSYRGALVWWHQKLEFGDWDWQAQDLVHPTEGISGKKRAGSQSCVIGGHDDFVDNRRYRTKYMIPGATRSHCHFLPTQALRPTGQKPGRRLRLSMLTFYQGIFSIRTLRLGQATRLYLRPLLFVLSCE